MQPTGVPFGVILREERIRRGLNQKQLANRIGTSQQNIGHWEAGRSLPRQELQDRLIQFFGKESPIAALPARGDLVLPKESLKQYEQYMEYLAGIPPGAPDVKVVRQTIKDKEQEATSDFEFGVRESVRPEFRTNFEVTVQPRLRADYLSKKLCLEIKYLRPNQAHDPTVRLGYYQLIRIRTLIEGPFYRPPGTRHYVLAMVLTSTDHLLNRDALRIVEEGDALGLDLVYCTSPQSIADLIHSYEDLAPSPDGETAD